MASLPAPGVCKTQSRKTCGSVLQPLISTPAEPKLKVSCTVDPKAKAHFYLLSLLLKCRLQNIVHYKEMKSVLYTVVAEL